MKNFKNFAARISWQKLSIFEKLLLLAPVAIWFSYFPNFQIGRGEGTNFEFSIALFFVLVLAISAIFEIWRARKEIFRNRAFLLTGIFIGWNLLSIFWSENPTRAILNSGVWGCLWLIFGGILCAKNFKKITPILEKTLICSSTFASILTILQVAYGAFTDWGLCRGCLAAGFGFVRPSLFAIEPQFLGSLLLAPILVLLWKFLTEKLERKTIIFLALNLIAIYLTLSRGAIFALAPSVILLVFLAKKSAWNLLRRIFAAFSIVALSFAGGMVVHAIFTELNPRISDGFLDSISKSVNQMSLGKISLKLPHGKFSKPVEKSVENSPKNQPQIPEKTPASQKNGENSPKNPPQKIENPPQKKAIFDGYVEKSTDERTKLSNLALQTWSRNPQTIFAGVGAGGAGRAILRHTRQTGTEFEIIQNEFLSILLELGIFGLATWAVIIGGFILKSRKNPLALSVILAFLLQWNFFSGLPNALHIYLILAAFFVIIERAYEKNSAIN